MSKNIELKPVKDLLGMKFFIPGYQRGYRWKTNQVEDLLDDIYEFMKSGTNGKYCLQPLVVIKKYEIENIKELAEKAVEAGKIDAQVAFIYDAIDKRQCWEVVDGQQRLTTIYILLDFLNNDGKSSTSKAQPAYNIQYETRPGNFLEFIGNNDDKYLEYIDYWHMRNAYLVVKSWFTAHVKDVEKEKFKKCLLDKTEFIWYETDEHPIEVFTRLNIGKISLTNSELVKALFLNNSNFIKSDVSRDITDLPKNEIAILWDKIEYTLQKNEFWNFIQNDEYTHPTRIDFILDLVKELDVLEVRPKPKGNDHYKIFRYFYQAFENIKQSDSQYSHLYIWNEIKRIFDIFVEWYNDVECYHYMGFLVICSEREKRGFDFKKYLKIWEGCHRGCNKLVLKTEFVKHLKKDVYKIITNIKGKIEEKIKNNTTKVSWLDYTYEQADGLSKTECFPLLLLFNIHTTVKKNLHFKTNHNLNSSDFQRFPFHMFKNVEGWDIEHIASNTINGLVGEDEKIKWLESSIGFLPKEIKTDIELMIKNLKSPNSDKQNLEEEFNRLRQKIETDNLDDDERNKIWNFCLLDQSTNRSYGNSIFAQKRTEILKRDKEPLILDSAEENQPPKLRFILECTKNVFTKYYTTEVTNLQAWSEKDAKMYLKSMQEMLQDFDNLKSL